MNISLEIVVSRLFQEIRGVRLGFVNFQPPFYKYCTQYSFIGRVFHTEWVKQISAFIEEDLVVCAIIDIPLEYGKWKDINHPLEIN